jgi:preprotein translocase subunit YajC
MNKLFLQGLSIFLLSGMALHADEAAPAASQGNMMQTFIMIGLALVFFYFILWRPEQKRRKQLEKQRSSMKKGDRVTAMGIVGKVDKVQEKTVILKMVDGSKIEVLSGAITEVQPGSEEEAKRVDLSPADQKDK